MVPVSWHHRLFKWTYFRMTRNLVLLTPNDSSICNKGADRFSLMRKTAPFVLLLLLTFFCVRVPAELSTYNHLQLATKEALASKCLIGVLKARAIGWGSSRRFLLILSRTHSLYTLRHDTKLVMAWYVAKRETLIPLQQNQSASYTYTTFSYWQIIL